jgi:Initiator Replication protein
MRRSFTPDGSSPSRSEARIRMFISRSVRGSNGSGPKQRNGCRITSPKTRPISDYGASTLCACTVGQKQHLAAGTKRITLDRVRKLLGLESVKDSEGNVIREAPLSVWANLRQRALDTAIAEINKKTDLHVEIESLEKLGNRVNAMKFSIKTQEIPKAGRAKP